MKTSFYGCNLLLRTCYSSNESKFNCTVYLSNNKNDNDNIPGVYNVRIDQSTTGQLRF